jgi:rhodanese-related sulfurtransferase
MSLLLGLGLLALQDVEHSREPLEAVRTAVEKKEALLVDVREAPEWEAGRLRDARLLALSALKTASAEEVAKALPKGVVYLHCRSGARALTAARILKDLGYDARPLKPGFEELRRAGFAEAK